MYLVSQWEFENQISASNRYYDRHFQCDVDMFLGPINIYKRVP